MYNTYLRLQQVLYILPGKPKMLASIYFHIKFVSPSLICLEVFFGRILQSCVWAAISGLFLVFKNNLSLLMLTLTVDEKYIIWIV